MMKRIAVLGITIVTSVTLAACGRDTEESSAYGSVDSLGRRDTAKVAGETRRTTPRSDAAAREAAARAERDRVARANTVTLAAGTNITLTNDATISSRHQEIGQRVTATNATDVLDARSRVAIPAGTKFIGRITQLESATGQNDTARMTLEFNAIEVNGNAVPLMANVTSMNVVARSRGVTAGDAGKVGAGTVIGGAAGRVIGGNRTGTIVGAVIGTAAGVVVANATRETDIVLDRGSTLELRLTGPFSRVIASGN